MWVLVFATVATAQQCVSVSWASQTPMAKPGGWNKCVGSGHAYLVLREGYADQLAMAHKELGIGYVRFHGIFDDDVGVWKGVKGTYDFTNVKRIYDVVMQSGVKPFVELSFMPASLAMNDRTVFAYRAHTSPPKDWSAWGDMIEAFTRFLVQTYGFDEVKTWPFEVWNEPNCGPNGYMQMYRVTAAAVKRVSPDIKVGGPASAQLGLLNSFIRHCMDENLPLDFVSTHSYPTDPVLLQEPTGFSAALEGMTKMVQSYIPGIPIYLSEYNSGLFADLNHDSSFASSYIILAASDLIQRKVELDLWSYWTFSDIFEEQGWIPTEFHNGFGMITINGVPKPAYRAMQLLNLPSVAAGTAFSSVVFKPCTPSGATDPVTGTQTLYALARPFVDGRAGGVLYITNWDIRDSDLQAKTVSVDFGGAVKAMTSYRLDEGNGNPRAAWILQGQPMPPSHDQLNALMAASQINVTRQPTASGAFTIPPYGLLVLEVEMQSAQFV
jgi:xylan 1,4-beta-xylosidase